MDGHGHARRATATAATGRDDRLERVDVADLVAEDHDRARAVPRDQPLDRLALAAGSGRPQVHDRPAAVVGEAVVARGRSRASTAAIAATTAARAAATSSAWRTWNATDGPLRSTNSHGGDPSSSRRRAARIAAGRRAARTPGP